MQTGTPEKGATTITRPFSSGVEGDPFLLSKRGCLQNGEKTALRRIRWPETLEITSTSLFSQRYAHSQIIHRTTLRNIYFTLCNLMPEKFNTLTYKYKSLHHSHPNSSPETPLCAIAWTCPWPLLPVWPQHILPQVSSSNPLPSPS